MTVMKYTVGFVLSLLLTATAYLLVVNGSASMWLYAGIGILALVQMIVQLVFFLHLGEESGPRYKIVSFIIMAGVLVIVVVGSLWIMANLDYNMMNMSSEEKTNYMLTQHDKGF